MKTLFRWIDQLTIRKASMIIAVIGLMLYANTFSNQLFWDDYDSIVNNEYIKSWKYIPQYFSQNLTAGAGIKDNYWRPLLLFSFSLDYKIGGLTPFWYHLQNLFWHVVSAILVFAVVKRLLTHWQTTYSEESLWGDNMIAFLTAIIFLVHPLQTEAVTYVAGRADPMHSALMLGAFLCFLKYLDQKFTSQSNQQASAMEYFSNRSKKIHSVEVKVFFTQKKYLIYSLGLFILSLLVKERAIVLAGIVGGYVFLFLGTSLFDQLKRKIMLALPYVVITAIYLILRLTVLHFTDTFDLGAQEHINAPTLAAKIFTILKGFAIYQGLLLWPAKLYMEKSIGAATSLFEPLVIIGLATMLGWLGIAWWQVKRNPLITFGILWFFGALSISIHVFPIQGLLYEHWLYFPMIGLWLAVILSVKSTCAKIQSHKLQIIMISLVIIYLVGFGVWTMVRNRDWYDPVRFYEMNVSLGGTSARVLTNLGMAYADSGRQEDAIMTYKKAIQMNDKLFQPWYNLGNSCQSMGNQDEAVDAYKQAIALNPSFQSAYTNIAAIEVQRERFENARQILQQAIAQVPENVQLYYNLGVVALRLNDTRSAREYLEKAADLDPQNFELMQLLNTIPNDK